MDGEHAIAHNKVIVVDGETVVTGSYNFTQQAERRNAENLLVLHDAALAGKYGGNWEAHRQHSQRRPLTRLDNATDSPPHSRRSRTPVAAIE